MPTDPVPTDRSRGTNSALLAALLGTVLLWTGFPGGAVGSALLIPVCPIPDDPPDSPPAATPHEAGEVLSVTEVSLGDPTGPGGPEGCVVRLHMVGNPPRRPALPDLSREGEHALPGRPSFEVSEPGLAWADRTVPPGVYRLFLATDGIEPRLLARPLAPAPDLDLPIEVGTFTSPAPRFTAVLGESRSAEVRSGHLSVRWGVLALHATFTRAEVVRTRGGEWNLGALAALEKPEPGRTEVYLGVLEGGETGARSAARWILAEGEPRLRLELVRHRHLFALRREYAGRADRIANLARSAAAAGDDAEARRIGLLAESYEERAARIERSLRALSGSGREITGKSRAAAGERTAVTLDEREGAWWLVVDSPAGGAEFRLP